MAHTMEEPDLVLNGSLQDRIRMYYASQLLGIVSKTLAPSGYADPEGITLTGSTTNALLLVIGCVTYELNYAELVFQDIELAARSREQPSDICPRAKH